MTDWTKLNDGSYRYRNTAYSTYKSEGGHSSPKWHILLEGKLLGIATEPTRQYAGYAIDAELAGAS